MYALLYDINIFYFIFTNSHQFSSKLNYQAIRMHFQFNSFLHICSSTFIYMKEDDIQDTSPRYHHIWGSLSLYRILYSSYITYPLKLNFCSLYFFARMVSRIPIHVHVLVKNNGPYRRPHIRYTQAIADDVLKPKVSNTCRIFCQIPINFVLMAWDRL